MNWDIAAEHFLKELSSSNPTPGGGAASAVTGAMGCALAMMAVSTTLKRKATPQEVCPKLKNSLQKLQTLQKSFQELMKKDAAAYESYLSARKLPKENPQRSQSLEKALWAAASVPADTATAAVHCLQEINTIKGIIAAVIQPDVQCAQHLLQAAICCAVENINANISLMKDERKKTNLQKQADDFLNFL
ncbi:MAG: cyclodeaminase/cyclohydrolase family protein [Elusimicrobiaceae bacterium]|nr:cyclodeaminase/cyclohydrolase family protein [Elusimicrobiaceae bacterium]